MNEENIKLLMKFIVDNKLKFDTHGSGLNSACVVLCGFALHNDIEDTDEIVTAVDRSFIKIPDNRYVYVDELNRVFGFADMNNYGAWWDTEDAKKQYKF